MRSITPLPPVAALVASWILGAGIVRAEKVLPRFELLAPLSREQAARTAIVAGSNGAPLPAQWTVVVHDMKAPAGVREYVIAGGEIISQRAASDLTAALKSADVLGLQKIKVFPPQLADLATQYVAANDAVLGPIDFLLKKEGADAAPLWTVTCHGEAEAVLGVLVVTAGKGQVISHDGFAKEPASTVPSEVAAADTEFLERGETSVEESESKSGPAGKRTSSSSSGKKGSTVSRPFRKVGGKLQKFFTGKDTISR